LSEHPQDLKAARQALLKSARFAIVAVVGHTSLVAGSHDAADNDARETSSYIRSVISAGLPKFQAKQPQASAPSKNAGTAQGPTATASDVIAMPAFTITEAKLPSSRQTMTYAGWTQPLVDKYMGPSDGIDRGILNRFTLAQLWAKIPIIGRLPFVGTAVQMSVAERALDDAGANNPLRTKPIE
jgi:hypothetical protein